MMRATAVFGFAQIGNDALVDTMRIHDDSAFGGLPEHLGQTNHRDGSARNHVSQDLARTDRRQLIDITDYEQGCFVWDRLDQRIHQQHVHQLPFRDGLRIPVGAVYARSFEQG
jgi:hypothetical protein